MREDAVREPAVIERGATSGATIDSVRPFRIRFFNRSGRVLGRVPIVAPDADAAGITAVLRDACADVCAWAELWSGPAPVAYATEFSGYPTRNEMSAAAQKIVVDREIALRDSRTLIAESRRLLAKLSDWSDGDQGGGIPA